jgi:hypothetical protein
MSQIEQNFRQYLSRHPEIEKCYLNGLINRRSLARYIITSGLAKSSQFDAVVAMIRRYQFNEFKKEIDCFVELRLNIKDNILIIEFEKDKQLMQKLQSVILHTNYDKGDTLKIVVGTAAIKVFIDKENENKLKDLLKIYQVKNRFDKISEVSIMFTEKATKAKGILAAVTRELYLNDIPINELLTGAPELLIYLKDDYVLKAYEIIKGLQKEKIN